jgi:hypothetical protein
MDLYQFLHERTNDILEEAEQAIRRAHLKNYEREGSAAIHQKLRALFVLTARGVKERNLGPMIDHAGSVARERFGAEALGLVSTVLGTGKDTLARVYVTLASKSRTPTLDLRSLFTGMEGH